MEPEEAGRGGSYSGVQELTMEKKRGGYYDIGFLGDIKAALRSGQAGGVFTFEYNPEEFYWLTERELELIKSGLTKLPYEISDWLGMRTTLYSNEPDNMVVVMDCGG